MTADKRLIELIETLRSRAVCVYRDGRHYLPLFVDGDESNELAIITDVLDHIAYTRTTGGALTTERRAKIEEFIKAYATSSDMCGLASGMLETVLTALDSSAARAAAAERALGALGKPINDAINLLFINKIDGWREVQAAFSAARTKAGKE